MTKVRTAALGLAALVLAGDPTQATTTIYGPAATVAAVGANFNPRNFGAVGDGTPRSVSATLNVTTLAGLIAYSVNGATPYSWAGTYPYGNLFNLPLAQGAAIGATTLYFGTTQTSSTGLTVASGSQALPMNDVAGIAQGMSVSCPGTATGTYVDFVNPSRQTVHLSKPPASDITASATCTFSHPWLANVTVGMTVQGPVATISGLPAAIIPAGTTVTSVNLSTGAVGLSQATTNAALTVVTLNTAGTPANHDAQITFWSPFSDAQAAALQMDSLGIIAAEQAVERSGVIGGEVQLGYGAYVMDQGVVLPLAQEGIHGLNTTPSVNIVGQGIRATRMIAYSDLGPGRALISCGDPTGTQDNERGRYGLFNPSTANSALGQECFGYIEKLEVTTPTYTTNVALKFGMRPLLNGAPVLMDGVFAGARRTMRDDMIDGFRMGINFAGDHTEWDHVYSQDNFCGVLMDDAEVNAGNVGLFGDLGWSNMFLSDDNWAGLCIGPNAYWQGNLSGHNYLGGSLFAIYGMPGLPISAPAMIANSRFDGDNAETERCGTIIDGNTVESSTDSGLARGMHDVTFDTFFTAQPSSPDATAANIATAGCVWHAYINVFSAYGIKFTNVAANTFPVVSGSDFPSSSFLMITKQTVASLGTGQNQGGILFEGSGMQTILNGLSGLSKKLVGQLGNVGAQFDVQGQYNYVTVSVPGAYEAQEWLVEDSGATSLPTGTLMETSPTLTSGAGLTAERAGVAAAGSVKYLGVNITPFPAPPSTQLAFIAKRGSALPVLVSAAAPLGTLLKIDTANPGKAMVATAITDVGFVGVVTDANNGSATLVYMQGDP